MNKELLLVAIGSIGIVLFFGWVIHTINMNLVTGAWVLGIASGIFIHHGATAIAYLIKDTKWFKSGVKKQPKVRR